MSSDYRSDSAFMALVAPVISHPTYERLKDLKHHHNSVYDHSLSVTWGAYRIGKLFRMNVEELVRGALLHDFFLYSWHDMTKTIRDHLVSHPAIALKNARECFGTLTEREADIIFNHMWPITFRLPKFRETHVVALVDKFLTVVEFVDEAFSLLFPQREESRQAPPEG